MKANKLMKALAASAMSLALVAGMTAMPGMAAVDASTGITFTKTINMTAAPGATVPDAEYTYTIVAGDAVAATATSPKILEGVGNPTIGSAEFSPSDTISSDKVSKTVTVDFGGVTFDHAGIYRYVITETDPNVVGLTTDGKNTIYLDVYVTNANGGGVEISNYIMSTSANAPTYGNANAPTYVTGTKYTGDEDTYTTYTLTVTKNVEGAMADMTQKFSIDVDFTDLSAGTKVTVGGVQTADGASADGALSVSKSLGDNESMTITGVPADAVYTVVENIAQTDGYTTTATVQKGTGEATPADVTPAAQTQTVATQTMGLQNNAVVVTNTKNAVNPTGIIMNVAPYALMVVIALAGVVVFLRKRVED